MSTGKKPDATERFEQALAKTDTDRYVLRLFIAGTSRQSQRAVQNLIALCEEHMPGRYDLEVVDIFQQPQLAAGVQIVAAPTLVKKLPPPLRKLVGDLSQVDKVLLGLGLQKGDKKKEN